MIKFLNMAGQRASKDADIYKDIFRILEMAFKMCKVKESRRADHLYCYLAVLELGYGLTDLVRRLGMIQPGIGSEVRRGEQTEKDNNLQHKN